MASLTATCQEPLSNSDRNVWPASRKRRAPGVQVAGGRHAWHRPAWPGSSQPARPPPNQPRTGPQADRQGAGIRPRTRYFRRLRQSHRIAGPSLDADGCAGGRWSTPPYGPRLRTRCNLRSTSCNSTTSSCRRSSLRSSCRIRALDARNRSRDSSRVLCSFATPAASSNYLQQCSLVISCKCRDLPLAEDADREALRRNGLTWRLPPPVLAVLLLYGSHGRASLATVCDVEHCPASRSR